MAAESFSMSELILPYHLVRKTSITAAFLIGEVSLPNLIRPITLGRLKVLTTSETLFGNSSCFFLIRAITSLAASISSLVLLMRLINDSASASILVIAAWLYLINLADR